jgi:hypothetical protein
MLLTSKETQSRSLEESFVACITLGSMFKVLPEPVSPTPDHPLLRRLAHLRFGLSSLPSPLHQLLYQRIIKNFAQHNNEVLQHH